MASRTPHPEDKAPVPQPAPPTADESTPEVAAEPTEAPPEPIVEDVTAAEAAVASYERNNPDESGKGE